MKVISISLMVFMTAATTAWAQTANLTAPNGGETWKLNSKQKITWTFSGSAKMRLILIHKDGKVEGAIKTGLQLNTGSYEWTVGVLENGKTVSAKNDFLVTIIRHDDAVLDTSHNTFTIDDSQQIDFNLHLKLPPELFSTQMKVTSPAKNTKWWAGNTYKITWDKGRSGDAKVGINLYRQGEFVNTVSGFIANTGAHLWTIPDSIPPANDYVMKVFTFGDKFQADSGLFSILARQQFRIGARIDNSLCWSMHNEWSSNLGCGLSQHSTQPAAQRAAGEIVVGFDNFYDSGYCWEYVGHIYRGFVSFDLSEVKGNVVSASLGMVRTASLHRYGASVSNNSQCAGSVHVMDGTWSVDNQGNWHGPCHFYHALPTIAGNDGTVKYDGRKMLIDVTGIVKGWLSGQQANFGLMFIGLDEGYAHNNDACYSNFGSIFLSILVK
ncbi:MAG: GPI anchored serine-threonine rich family protein [Candidatus Aminicenantes bacterium]|nr:GPI anchored serine-threonine rich family protein [Candidatus Aminicenantes bacterium]